jgi:hypothetical protein
VRVVFGVAISDGLDHDRTMLFAEPLRPRRGENKEIHNISGCGSIRYEKDVAVRVLLLTIVTAWRRRELTPCREQDQIHLKSARSAKIQEKGTSIINSS